MVDQLASVFEGHRSLLLEDAVLEVLHDLGVPEIGATELADRRYLQEVQRQLEKFPPEKLPFDVSLGRPIRLIGKERPRLKDSEATKELRGRLKLIGPLRETLAEIGDSDFEALSAVVLLRAGATDAVVTAPGNEGGVDFFGRIPVLVGDPRLPPGLVRTSLEIRPMLFLGQAKRYSATANVDRAELQKFAGQVRDCLNNYEGMKKPPPHRVPDAYYSKNEPCVPFFFTTAGFTGGARDYARSVNMILADGRLLAELLVYWGFGHEKLTSIEATVVVDWVSSIREASSFTG